MSKPHRDDGAIFVDVNPLVEEYARSCRHLEWANRSLYDFFIFDADDYVNCHDVFHPGYVSLSYATQFIFNHLCNHFTFIWWLNILIIDVGSSVRSYDVIRWRNKQLKNIYERMSISLNWDNFEILTNISCDEGIAPPPLHFQRRGLFIC